MKIFRRKKSREWRSNLFEYEDIVSVEYEETQDYIDLCKQLYSKDLISCPNESAGKAVIIPKDVLRYLFLDNIKHKIIHLRQTPHLSGEILDKITSRFQEDIIPHYYIVKTNAGDEIILKNLVVLETVKEIEKELFKK